MAVEEVHELRQIELQMRRVSAALHGGGNGQVAKRLMAIADELWVMTAEGKDREIAVQVQRDRGKE